METKKPVSTRDELAHEIDMQVMFKASDAAKPYLEGSLGVTPFDLAKYSWYYGFMAARTTEVAALTAERDNWKWEYENLCKFASDYQNEAERLKCAMERLTNREARVFPYGTDMEEIIHHYSQALYRCERIAREALAPPAEGKGE
jgi:hypothetical protein